MGCPLDGTWRTLKPLWNISRLGRTMLVPDLPSTKHSKQDRLRLSELVPMHNRPLGLNIKPDKARGLCSPLTYREGFLNLRENGNPWRSAFGYELEAIDLCLVPNVGLPADFKTPEFDKYKGSTCPRVHLAMYYRKMEAHIYDDKILIHYFQDSLTRAALSCPSRSRPRYGEEGKHITGLHSPRLFLEIVKWR
ncbi:hypothetical protein CR513_48949, partial [Mucuna pruriens]